MHCVQNHQSVTHMLYKLSFLYTHTCIHFICSCTQRGVCVCVCAGKSRHGCDPGPGFIFPEGTPVSLPAQLCSFSVDAQGSKKQRRAPHWEAGSKESAQGSRGWGAVTCQLETLQRWCVFQSVSKGYWHEPRSEGGRERSPLSTERRGGHCSCLRLFFSDLQLTRWSPTLGRVTTEPTD